ncbi:MAG TPA: penicillin-binding protein 2 [Chitinophagaceae bacterium]
MSVFNQSRSTIIRLIFISMFVVITLQLFNLQVLSGKYQQLARENALFPKRIYPSRGIIYDRKGKPILDNTVLYDLMVIPSEVRNLDTMGFCQMLEIDTAEFRQRLITAILKNTRVRPSIFEDLLPPVMHARLEENLWKYKGFYLQDRPVRTYPFNAAAHIMGYVGEVDSAILRRSNYYYQLGDYVGRSGLEQYYESVLMGRRGVQYMIRDNKNRLVGRYENGKFDTAAIAGRNLRTYIDIEVQQLAEKLMTNKVGAVVALDPKTGGIIAMCSGPNFNPNDLTGPEKQKNYQRMVLDVSGPLLNRAIKGLYPPGSAFKPLGALMALNDGIIDPSYGYPCTGRYYGCGHGKPACTHNNPGHAANLRLSIANSCNSYYTHLFRMTIDNPQFRGVKKGYQHWRDYANNFGLGNRLGVDLPSEDKGNIPDTAVYNRVYRGAWNSCTNLTLGIGQDMMLATPMQLANAMCIVANKGYFYTPHFVQKIDAETKDDTVMNKFRIKHEVLTRISDEAYESVIGGMQDVVDRGTAMAARIPGIEICAKTGTAENFRILDGRRVQLKDNSVFVCFAPRENPRIAIAVVVENAGFGSTWAAPIASLMMEKYLNDTLRAERKKEVDRIAAANLMPSWLEREQYKADSTRAAYWAKLTKDSTNYKKYLRKGSAPKKDSVPPKPDTRSTHTREAILEKKISTKPVTA